MQILKQYLPIIVVVSIAVVATVVVVVGTLREWKVIQNQSQTIARI